MFSLFSSLSLKKGLRTMDLETHTNFIRHIGNLLVLWPREKYTFHVRTAINIIEHNSITRKFLEDLSGKACREALLEAAAHLKIAADKVVKQQENR